MVGESLRFSRFFFVFDGFSLESAGLVAQYFDERNPAVMKGLETLIKAAKAKGK